METVTFITANKTKEKFYLNAQICFKFLRDILFRFWSATEQSSLHSCLSAGHAVLHISVK